MIAHLATDLVSHAPAIGRALTAALAVLLIRPLAPVTQPPLSRGRSIALALALAIGAAIYAAERTESYLTAFVVAVGLGFSGQAIIELVGREALAIARERMAGLRTTLGTIFKGGQRP